MKHTLKCERRWFQRTWDRKKTFEVRKNDRDYQVGDRVELNEVCVDSGGYSWMLGSDGVYATGHKITARISYVFDVTTLDSSSVKPKDRKWPKGGVVLQLVGLENHKAPKKKAKK